MVQIYVPMGAWGIIMPRDAIFAPPPPSIRDLDFLLMPNVTGGWYTWTTPRGPREAPHENESGWTGGAYRYTQDYA